MGYWSHLLRVEIAAIVSLLVYAAALTAVLALGSGAFSSEPQSSGEALRSFGLVLWFSILPTAFVFAPVYALSQFVYTFTTKHSPSPPATGPIHHYVFELYALNSNLDLPPNASRDDLIKAMAGKTTAKAAYVGRYRNETAPAK